MRDLFCMSGEMSSALRPLSSAFHRRFTYVYYLVLVAVSLSAVHAGLERICSCGPNSARRSDAAAVAAEQEYFQVTWALAQPG